MSTLTLRFELQLFFDPPMDYPSLSGARGYARLQGGHLAGPGIDARVMEDGGDHEVFRDDGVVDLDGRYFAQSDDGIAIYIQSRGFRLHDGALRCSLKIEVPAGRLQWLSRTLLVGIGERQGDLAILRCYEVD